MQLAAPAVVMTVIMNNPLHTAVSIVFMLLFRSLVIDVRWPWPVIRRLGDWCTLPESPRIAGAGGLGLCGSAPGFVCGPGLQM
jgi:hypothetical protein